MIFFFKNLKENEKLKSNKAAFVKATRSKYPCEPICKPNLGPLQSLVLKVGGLSKIIKPELKTKNSPFP